MTKVKKPAKLYHAVDKGKMILFYFSGEKVDNKAWLIIGKGLDQ